MFAENINNLAQAAQEKGKPDRQLCLSKCSGWGQSKVEG